MPRPYRTLSVCLCLLACASNGPIASADSESVHLVVAAGRPLRVRLDERITVKHVGQPVTATVVEPLYALDRIVIPAGATVSGRIARLETPSKWSRVRTMLGGDFTPRRTPAMQFDTLTFPDGRRIAISTAVGAGREYITLAVTSASRPTSVASRAKEKLSYRAKEAVRASKRRVADAVAAVKAPEKMSRLKELAVSQLPYHPQYIHAGTIYNADLLAAIEFGDVTPVERALPEEAPAPLSILTARLLTPLDSAKTSRGSPIHALLTQPVFSADHRLIFPEGTTLEGEVTFARGARWLHRNGQMRFLIERAHLPGRDSQPLLGSLYAVEAAQDKRIVVDDEGGTSVADSRTRFIPPALALMALHAAADQDRHRHFDNDADDSEPVGERANIGGRGVAGWFGLGLFGAGLGQVARPAAVWFGLFGSARTTYSNILGKGSEVSFPADTVIQIQLSPGQTPRP